MCIDEVAALDVGQGPSAATTPDGRHLLQVSILCWHSGTTSATQLRTTSPVTPPREATSKSTGCAPTAQQGKSTAGQQCQCIVPANSHQRVPFAVAERPASATRWRRCTLTEQQSETMRRTQTGPANTLQVPVMLSGGALPSGAAGSSQFWLVQYVQKQLMQDGNLLKLGQLHSIIAASKRLVCFQPVLAPIAAVLPAPGWVFYTCYCTSSCKALPVGTASGHCNMLPAFVQSPSLSPCCSTVHYMRCVLQTHTKFMLENSQSW